MQKTNHVALNTMHQKNQTAYRFSDPDPIMDLLRHAITTAMDEDHMTIADIAADAMCAYQTVARIVDAQTKRPMNGTVDRILKACGYTRSIVRSILDANGKTLDAQSMYEVLNKIATQKLTSQEIVALVRKTLGKTNSSTMRPSQKKPISH